MQVKFFVKLDHPNCHYLLGAKTTLDKGGLMTLTEVCEHGSLFDLYCQNGKTFNNQDGQSARALTHPRAHTISFPEAPGMINIIL